MKKLIVFILLSQLALAQENPVNPQRYFGIGYKLGAFQASELSNFMPVNRFIVSVDPIKYFRFDVQWGMSNATREQWVTTPTGAMQAYNVDDKNSVWQVGAFGTASFDDLLMFFGLRYGMAKGSNEYLDYGSSGIFISSETLEGKMISPVLGAEFRFGNRFAVGAELAYLMTTQTHNFGNPGEKDAKGKINMIETCAFFRFFPF